MLSVILNASLLKLANNVFGFCEGKDFYHKLDLRNQCLINYKTAFGIRNLAFMVGVIKGQFNFPPYQLPLR
jgi:hypothetical protein